MCMCSRCPTSQGRGVDRSLSPGIKLLIKPGTVPQVLGRECAHLDTNLHYCLVFSLHQLFFQTYLVNFMDFDW